MFPEIVDMNLPVEGAFHNLVLVSIKKQYPMHASARRARPLGLGADVVLEGHLRRRRRRRRAEPAEVAWRLLANLDPKRDITFVDGPIDQLDHGANQAALRQQDGYRRDEEVARGGLHARVAGGLAHDAGDRGAGRRPLVGARARPRVAALAFRVEAGQRPVAPTGKDLPGSPGRSCEPPAALLQRPR